MQKCSVQRGSLDHESDRLEPATTSSIAVASRASHSTSIIVSLAGSRLKIRLWLISMMLTPASWNWAVIDGERAGPVLGGDLEPRDPPLADEVADQDVGEQMGVDIAAAQDGRDLAALEPPGIVEDRREPGRAGALDHRLFDPDQHRHRLLERALGHEDEVVGQLSLRIREVSSPGCLTAMPSASVSPPSGKWQPSTAHFIDG